MNESSAHGPVPTNIFHDPRIVRRTWFAPFADLSLLGRAMVPYLVAAALLTVLPGGPDRNFLVVVIQETVFLGIPVMFGVAWCRTQLGTVPEGRQLPFLRKDDIALVAMIVLPVVLVPQILIYLTMQTGGDSKDRTAILGTTFWLGLAWLVVSAPAWAAQAAGDRTPLRLGLNLARRHPALVAFAAFQFFVVSMALMVLFTAVLPSSDELRSPLAKSIMGGAWGLMPLAAMAVMASTLSRGYETLSRR